MNAFSTRLWRTGAAAAVLAAVAAHDAAAQSPQATAIAACLCLHRSLAPLSADMQAKTAALDQLHAELARLDAELARDKPRVDVDDPAAVNRYRALLERRDALYRQSAGPAQAAAAAAVAGYDARAEQYNRECANHPFDAALMREVEASLACPAPP